jgi:hypothetical protein
LGPFVHGKRPDAQLAAGDLPNQRGLREDAAVQIRGLAFGVLVEHLPASRRSPPDDHAIRFGKNVRRQYLGLDAAAERTHQRLDEREGERLRRTERGWPALLDQNVMPGDETRLTVAVDEQSLTQLEAVILTDRKMDLHDGPPTHESIRQAKTVPH